MRAHQVQTLSGVARLSLAAMVVLREIWRRRALIQAIMANSLTSNARRAAIGIRASKRPHHSLAAANPMPAMRDVLWGI